MRRCGLCGSVKIKELFELRDKKIVECSECGLVRTDNFEMPDYEHYHRDKEYVNCSRLFTNIFRKRFNIIKRYRNGGAVLDVGASSGEMLGIFSGDGWECWGVEPSVVAQTQRFASIKILRAEFEKVKLPDKYFDVVVLNHTLEHMMDPVLVMKKVGNVLKKGGIVLVDVPNFGSLSRKVLGRSWPYLLPEEHLWHFTPESMKKVFEKAGLEVIHWESRSGIFEYANALGDLLLSLITFKKRFFYNLAGAPGAFISTVLNKGTSFSMVGKRL